MSHIHNKHGKHSLKSERALEISLGLVIVTMIAEVIGGLLSHSLALLSDAGHMLIDALALGLSLLALRLSRRPATSRKTFGLLRTEVMAALINGTTLILVSTFIMLEAYRRFRNPLQIDTPVMLSIAVIGLFANITGVILLRRAGRMNLNVRAAFWHITGDTISSIGVIVAGIVISVTGWSYADPLIAVTIGVIILWGAVQLVRESVNILLESVPKQITLEKVIARIKAIEGVEDIHDIHVWTITSGFYALSAHIVVRDIMVSQSVHVMENINRLLAENFNITHTTLQIECGNCPTGNICTVDTRKY